jgi:uncharacterized membrane protein YtjA (UPF0391 family)
MGKKFKFDFIFAPCLQALSITLKRQLTMNLLTITFFVIAMMAAILAFTTDIDAIVARNAKYGFFISLGLMFLSVIIGAVRKHKSNI